MNACDQLLLELGGQLRRPQDLPPCRHRTGELSQKVLHATLAATEMVEQDLTHDAPSESGSPADCGVDVSDADDALAHQIIHLSGQSGLQTIGDMPGHFFVQADGPLAQGSVELRGAPDGLLRRFRSTDYFD